MNIQGSSMMERRPAARQSGGRKFGIALQIVAFLGGVAILANFYVYFNQKISEADREMLRLRSRLAGVEREIDSYRLQYERYSAWPHIRDSIRRFNLPLRQATPDQCRRLAMIPPSLAPGIPITFRDAAVQQPTAELTPGPAVRNTAPASRRTVPRAVPAGRRGPRQPLRYSHN